jgi:predicted O-methyltransferase YrrM
MIKYISKKALKYLPKSVKSFITMTVERRRFVKEYGSAYFEMSQFKSVPGFLLDQEGKFLFDTVTDLKVDGPVIVEIGSWLGKSAVVFGSALKKKGGGTLHCVDLFNCDGDQRSKERYLKDAEKIKNSLLKEFELNTRICGVNSNIKVHVGDSVEVARGWNINIDIIFIDGDHSYAGVAADFDSWVPWVKVGGLVCFHDTLFEKPIGTESYHQGPGMFVKEKIINSPNWGFVSHIGSLYCTRKLG